ncbi:c-type cytochrome biogenesis protein CcsB [Riemerella anatipestifer]|uniref:c-type cytochrome biogenesis protein CcsB n=1 Tax=Riemerella anatipestifer TaxID=34085 RepID=UPI0021D59D9E|nr:c-type cytochrome biogenesis protein CcsB [Riemerella anatipestifer]MCU7574042.1 c-type cytochrome biogenesis protein CcsB [Riemerella anatipestifer]MCU7595202.1 c-type cytochrome biogenesis protein CcsB [Riemerella anatipestifer]MDR7819478.1 c-type cytochrome biogenesis protein CcsB [Riemerella anatipestifer]MDR7876272.1 c-type cytochrome biogenesis protein CcsB [Riemerella anatipestifer]MDW3553836.1 c-type cytochrome biogenesis protein CcsB [Riemerella anatipestifer]
MKKIQNILVSTRTMAVLLLVYALSMAYATFMENDYGTPTAKAFIYESKWFEAIMFLLIINFIGNIGRYRLWKREKWPLLAFHLSFILLFIGGAITRYISYEGTMHIREGETSNEIVTSKNFFKIQIEEKGEVLNYADIPFLMTPEVPFWSKVTNHYFKATYDFNGKKIKVKQLAYTPRKKDSIKVTPNGKEYLHFVTTDDAGRLEYYLSEGEVKNIGGTLVTYNRPIDGAVEFKKQDGKLYIKTPVDATYMVMASQEVGASPKDEYTPLSLRSLYTINQMRIVVPEGLKRGEIVSYSGDKKKDKNIPDELLLEVEGPKTKQQVSLQVQEGNPNLVKQISLDGMNMMLGFGAKVYTTPFALKLDDFVMETYPGSSSPSAYESHVQIIDNGKQTPYKIYMNNVLNYRGYRFFQSSFDPDRHGTILSVNHDYWGTLITYIGYTLMFIAMFITLFWKGTRFWSLNKMLKDISKKKALGILLLVLSFGFLQAQPKTPTAKPSTQKVLSADDMVQHINIDKAHAEKFGSLLVQSYDGRIQPVNTQALDILRKLTGKESFKQLDANQWFLSATIDPMFWAQVHIIKVETRGKVGEELKKKTKANDEGYTSLVNLFPADKFGNLRFVLEDDYNEAFNKKPAEQSKYDQAVIKLNDKVQVMNALMSWQYFRVIPVQNDPNHKWNSVMDANFQIDTNAQEVLGPYLSSVLMATQSDKWATADKELDKVKSYQAKWGKNVIPPQTKIDLEILMNKLNLNFKLMIFYSVVAALLLVLGFVELFKPSRWLHKVIKVILAAGILGYLVHFVGLGIRWYISGHAPWSNGYEAIMFISWVGISAGLLLYRNNNALIPSAGFLVAVLLMGFAHGAVSLDPQITPLVPVLKSYWLVIHVAIITSSYGFFALSFIIGIMVLLFYIVSSKATFQEHNDTTIKELTAVSEMSLTIGLFALTIGTFLGGVWANESWGRYWSWDPKETWAFISVMVYAFVLHMRLVPGLRGRYAFHMVTMFAFSSVIMTYFGVNYYLSGLHSYAAGDPIPVPAWVYITGASMITISLAAWFKYKKLNSKN